MIPLKKIPDKGDPSDILQIFPAITPELLCCRYWCIKEWEFNTLSYPYWRIYRNDRKGGVVIHNEKEYPLTPDKILMIAPNTNYSTRLFNRTPPPNGYMFKGNKADVNTEKNKLGDYVLHLFIHFKLGVLYDNVKPGVFEFDVTPALKEKIDTITNHLLEDHMRFSFHVALNIQSLIIELLSQIKEEQREKVTTDFRILDTLNYIEDNLESSLNNKVLAERARLATNAFNRLFRKETRLSPQTYVRKKRIDKSCVLLHHTNLSIEAVANTCGFVDRYHFSRVFKQITGGSPALYRKYHASLHT